MALDYSLVSVRQMTATQLQPQEVPLFLVTITCNEKDKETFKLTRDMSSSRSRTTEPREDQRSALTARNSVTSAQTADNPTPRALCGEEAASTTKSAMREGEVLNPQLLQMYTGRRGKISSLEL
jgi:hypothetical protein